MSRTLRWLLVFAGAVSAGSAACSSSSHPVAPPPGQATPVPPPTQAIPAVSPTRVPLSRTDPNVVEETETHIISRLPKSEYIRVDDRHIRNPVIAGPIEFFKEDDLYYYVVRQKRLPEEDALRRQQLEAQGLTPTPAGRKQPTSAVPLADFEDLAPERVTGRLRLEEVRETGLPSTGMWRASFVVADMNEDGIADIIAPGARMGSATMHVWLGDGKGRFSEWPLTFSEDGKPARLIVGYGGAAVGDIDGDGHMDAAFASHGGGLSSVFGDGKGGFRIVRTGLPRGDFSAQAIALVPVDGDGKLDLVASRDLAETNPGEPVDKMQVRVYLNRGKAGWELKKDGIVGGFYSNSLQPWDFDGDGRKDVLTGSHYTGALTLLWKNLGDGAFQPVSFDAIEIYAYHFATAPGTFGKGRAPAFADSYLMQTNVPQTARATGITVYAFENGAWSRHRVWRKKDGRSLQYSLAMGDLDGDGLDDVAFADSEQRRLRVFLQADGRFVEIAEAEEPELDSPGQCVRFADLDRDGRLDVVVSKTVTASDTGVKGGWSVYWNRAK